MLGCQSTYTLTRRRDTSFSILLLIRSLSGERLDNDPSGARYGCFLPDLTGLARCLPAPTSQPLSMSFQIKLQVLSTERLPS